jgi:hypothetical protein
VKRNPYFIRVWDYVEVLRSVARTGHTRVRTLTAPVPKVSTAPLYHPLVSSGGGPFDGRPMTQ